jgi:hypothetical protein
VSQSSRLLNRLYYFDNPIEWSERNRFKSFVIGCLLPIACFADWFTRSYPFLANWWPSEIFRSLLDSTPFLGFLPFLLYSAVSLGMYCVNPRTINRQWVRLGICTGAILSLQYLVLLMPLLVIVVPLMLSCSGMLAGAFALGTEIGSHFVPKSRQFKIVHLLIVTTIVAVLSCILVKLRLWIASVPLNLALILEFVVVAGTPLLAAMTYFRAAVNCFHHTSSTKLRWSISAHYWFGWLACWSVSWCHAFWHVYKTLW